MIAPGDLWPVLAKQAAGNALEAVDQTRQRDLRRVVDEQVNMIVFAVAFDQFRLEVAAYFGEDVP